MLRRVVEVASMPAPVEDGVVFLTDTATAGTIRDGDVYGGVRVSMRATIAGADVTLRLAASRPGRLAADTGARRSVLAASRSTTSTATS